VRPRTGKLATASKLFKLLAAAIYQTQHAEKSCGRATSPTCDLREVIIHPSAIPKSRGKYIIYGLAARRVPPTGRRSSAAPIFS
jgi:hypothetical protein